MCWLRSRCGQEREREREKNKRQEPFSKSEMHNNHKRNTNRSEQIKITWNKKRTNILPVEDCGRMITLIRYVIKLYNTVEDQMKQPLICKGSRTVYKLHSTTTRRNFQEQTKEKNKIKENSSSSSSSRCEERKEGRKKERKKERRRWSFRFVTYTLQPDFIR